MELGNALMGHSRGKYPIHDRDLYRELIEPLFTSLKADGYGIHFNNDVFEMHPYCWCDNAGCVQCDTLAQSNFLYKPTNFRLNWYKYAMRDAYTNQELTEEMFSTMIRMCVESLPVIGDVLPIEIVKHKYCLSELELIKRRLTLNSTYGAMWTPRKPTCSK